MWPFRRKIKQQILTPQQQAGMFIKSVTLPEATPKWYLFSKHDERWDGLTAIHEGYNASSIVYACVEKRAKLIASVPWKAMRRSGEDWEHEPNSPLQQLVDNPNPEQSFYELMYQVSQSMDLMGNAGLTKVTGGAARQPIQMWLLPWQYMRIKPGRERLVDYYEYEEDGLPRIRIQPEEFIQLKMPNPNSRWFGMPVLMAAGRPTDVDRESGIWQKVSLQNRGASDIHVQVPDGTTREQIEQAKDKWKERQSGPANAREPIFTSGDVKNFGQTAVEMDFVQSRQKVWEEISAVFGTPLATLGFTENVNLANAGAMDKMLWQNTIIPQLELLKRQLCHQVAESFGEEWKLVPDLSNVEALQEDFTDKLTNADKLWRMGVPFNEINQKLELGFDDIDGGDSGYLPSGLLPTDMAGMPMDVEPEESVRLHNLAYGMEHK